MSSTRAFFRGRCQKNLALGVWKNDAALVTAFRNEISVNRDVLLQLRQLISNFNVVGHAMDHVSDSSSPNRFRHVFAIEQYTIIGQDDI